MEIRLDQLDSQCPFPAGDTFITLRVGDVHKQTRLTETKTFKFPEAADARNQFGRIEIFQRIGFMTIHVGDDRSQMIDVPCQFSQDGCVKSTNLAMQVTTKASGDEKSAVPEKKQNKVVARQQRMDVVQEYVREHRLEQVVADAMREVIHAKPDDPHEFLSKQIMKYSSHAVLRPSPRQTSLKPSPNFRSNLHNSHAAGASPPLPPSTLDAHISRQPVTTPHKMLSCDGGFALPPVQVTPPRISASPVSPEPPAAFGSHGKLGSTACRLTNSKPILKSRTTSRSSDKLPPLATSKSVSFLRG